MIVLNNNSATIAIQFTKGSTCTIPVSRPAGSTFPAFTARTWEFNIYTQSNGTEIANGTVTVTDADNMTIVIPASVTTTLEWSNVKYGYNLTGTSGAIVDIPIKGNLIVHRADG